MSEYIFVTNIFKYSGLTWNELTDKNYISIADRNLLVSPDLCHNWIFDVHVHLQKKEENVFFGKKDKSVDQHLQGRGCLSSTDKSAPQDLGLMG